MRINFNDTQEALGFLREQTAHIETQVFEVKYPDIQYPDLVPIDTSANEWATSVVYYSQDGRGAAEWANAMGKDFPLVDTNRAEFSQAVHMANIGYRYGLGEIAQARQLGMNLPADNAKVARRAYEEMVDRIAIEGDTLKGLKGLVNQTTVTRVAVANGAATTPAWSTKTADEILTDINASVSGIWTASKGVELSDTVLLPPTRLALISGKRVGDTDKTVLDYVMRANLYTQQTGQPLKIRSLRQLETAGNGGAARMISYRRDAEALKLLLPMPLKFLPAQQVMLDFIVPGMFRIGGMTVRRPGSMRYSDDI